MEPGADGQLRLCVSAASRPAKSGNATVTWSDGALDSFAAAREHLRPVAHARYAGMGRVSGGAGGRDGTSSMATAVRDVTGSELRLFGDIVARPERLGPESDARAVILM